MYLDHTKAHHEEKCEETYKKLRKLITTIDENQRLNEFFLADEYLSKMEFTIKNQEKRLGDFLPKEFSIYNKIG